MPQLQLSDEHQHMLSNFINHEPADHPHVSDALAKLLEKIMKQVNVRRLELVDPEGVRDLLRSTFEIMKVHHLYENGLLSTTQFKARLHTLQDR